MDRLSFIEICRLPKTELTRLFGAGIRPQPDQLVDREFRGYNHPKYTGLLGIRKFVKGIFRENDQVEGYNRKVVQNRLEEPWIVTRAQAFGYYDVMARGTKFPNAILLHYGKSRHNPLFEPARLLRDYVVQIYPEEPNLLLGRAYASIFGWEIFLGYFILGEME